MKITEITGVSTNQATVTNYQKGKSATLRLPNGNMVTTDLEKNPDTITFDEFGNPIININPDDQDQNYTKKPISPGMTVPITNTPLS